jgi:hypothetical protein
LQWDTIDIDKDVQEFEDNEAQFDNVFSSDNRLTIKHYY